MSNPVRVDSGRARTCIGCDTDLTNERPVTLSLPSGERRYVCDGCAGTINNLYRRDDMPYARLRMILRGILKNDHSYPLRYHQVFVALSEALFAGLKAGVRKSEDGKADGEDLFAYIKLPNGCVEWLIDGHGLFALGNEDEHQNQVIRQFVGKEEAS